MVNSSIGSIERRDGLFGLFRRGAADRGLSVVSPTVALNSPQSDGSDPVNQRVRVSRRGHHGGADIGLGIYESQYWSGYLYGGYGAVPYSTYYPSRTRPAQPSHPAFYYPRSTYQYPPRKFLWGWIPTWIADLPFSILECLQFNFWILLILTRYVLQRRSLYGLINTEVFIDNVLCFYSIPIMKLVSFKVTISKLVW